MHRAVSFDRDTARRGGRGPAGLSAEASPHLPAFSLASVPGNPRPAGLAPGLFRTRDGLALRTAVHRGGPAPRGTVVLLQGRADFIEKYFEVVDDLVTRGFAVLTFDWRGQGGSQRLLDDPRLNHLDGLDDCIQDLIDIVDTEVAGRLPGPRIALAHSMGAAVLLHALARRPELFERAVLTAPMLAIAPALKPPGAEWLTRICHGLGLGGRPVPGPTRRATAEPRFHPGNVLTSDPVRYLRSHHVIAAAPHLAVGKPTIGWLRAAFDAIGAFRCPRFRGNLRTPLLVVAGDSDRVTCTPTAARFTRAIGCGTMLTLPSCAHDVLMERDPLRRAFWNAFDSFVTG